MTPVNANRPTLPKPSLRQLIVAAVAAVVVLAAVLGGAYVYKKLTTRTGVAYFSETLALYPGDKVEIMGAPVGSIDRIEPGGDKMKVTFHYSSKYKVPADATASILNPSLVASRIIQLSPPYTGGPQLADNAVIPLERTQVPVEYDQLRDSLNRILTQLGPTPDQPRGPFGDVIESYADGLAGKGKQIHDALSGLSEALNTLNTGRSDFFAVVKSLATFVNALHQNDQRFVALNTDFDRFTGSLTHSDHDLADAINEFDQLLPVVRTFVDRNGPALTKSVDNLADVTTTVLQPQPREALETFLHAAPNASANATNVFSPAQGALTAAPAIVNFANPMEFICSSIQAGSRLGYQDSAELCAQYLAPVLDAIKFNFLPFGANPLNTAEVLPKMVSYSDPRLAPPPGYKDTTVPGVWARDTLFSHGNHEPGWTVAPGMQGVDVAPATASMLTPESLGELMGGPDIAPPTAPDHFGPSPLPGPPDSYDETSPLPPPWYPQPGPPPVPAPGVIPGDPLRAMAPTAPAPPLPAEAGGGQ